VLLSILADRNGSLLCHAGTILSENFDELTPKEQVTMAGAFQAIVGNVDILGGSPFGYLCHTPESVNCIDLDGSTRGVLQSINSFMLEPGINYYLSFDLIGSQRGVATSTTVSFGPYNQTFALGSDDFSSGIVLNALVTVNTPAQAYLTFASNTDGWIGAVLDNVSITEQTSATPEPGTLVLISSGMLALFGIRKRWFVRN
jgi:PEP-CTERM motif-containing protein